MGGRSGGWGGWGGMQSQHCSLRWVGEKGQHLGNRCWDSKRFCIADFNQVLSMGVALKNITKQGRCIQIWSLLWRIMSPTYLLSETTDYWLQCQFGDFHGPPGARMVTQNSGFLQTTATHSDNLLENTFIPFLFLIFPLTLDPGDLECVHSACRAFLFSQKYFHQRTTSPSSSRIATLSSKYPLWEYSESKILIKNISSKMSHLEIFSVKNISSKMSLLGIFSVNAVINLTR